MLAHFPVTFRFKNTGPVNLYVDLTSGVPLAISSSTNPEPYALRADCSDSCYFECKQCPACFAPQQTVRVIAPGEHWDVYWDGCYFTFRNCPGASCKCHDFHAASAGTYEAVLSATLGSDAEPCSAHASFELPSEASIVETSFSCP
jgi:hypothetical protein